ncbi:hypothetical protein JYQ62_09025 [Nostoc sp. UHCC 0702]|nr:hypothetical protein JYQ62_09025 [Nostoc sp. UHCC 0702]
MEILIYILWLSIPLSVIVIIMLAFDAIPTIPVVAFPKTSRNSRPKSKPRPQSSSLFSAKDDVSGLKNRLLVLVQGDNQLAHRLVKQVKSRNPGRTEDWYLEKAIWDLERDRR